MAGTASTNCSAPSRRTFVKGVGGVFGAMALTPVAALAQQPTAAIGADCEFGPIVRDRQ